MTEQEQMEQATEEKSAVAVAEETLPEDQAATGAPAVEADAEPKAGAEETSDTAAEEGLTADVLNDPRYKWYVVHTYSGYENRAKLSLEERIRSKNMEEHFGEILIPTENVIELGKGGQKRTSKRKFFPGYMLVQMALNQDSWHVVKDTPKITGFVGGSSKPPPVPVAEVARLTQQMDEGAKKPKPRVNFTEGEEVRVVDGPFANFNGVVESVSEEKSKVRVLVSIFGRPTPVELEFIQVEKA